jgi:CRP-like cAMP-binding protein
MPGDALASKLGTVARLGDEDLAALHDLTRDSREVPARRNLIREGDRPDHVHLVVEGWAARYKLLPDGGRQILAFLLPGDLCDLHVTVLGQMDHSIATLTRARIAFIPTAAMERLAERPRLTRALWWSALVDEAVLRAWLTSIGRRDALERIGHLFCELFRRLCNVGLATGNGIELPLTQEEIGDALGLTPVHVNRVLQQMRADGLIVLKRGSLEIPDVARLEKVSGFDPSYLHIERRD